MAGPARLRGRDRPAGRRPARPARASVCRKCPAEARAVVLALDDPGQAGAALARRAGQAAAVPDEAAAGRVEQVAVLDDPGQAAAAGRVAPDVVAPAGRAGQEQAAPAPAPDEAGRAEPHPVPLAARHAAPRAAPPAVPARQPVVPARSRRGGSSARPRAQATPPGPPPKDSGAAPPPARRPRLRGSGPAGVGDARSGAGSAGSLSARSAPARRSPRGASPTAAAAPSGRSAPPTCHRHRRRSADTIRPDHRPARPAGNSRNRNIRYRNQSRSRVLARGPTSPARRPPGAPQEVHQP
jgi:hypothetical protein